ncbi:Rieske 2Fe-2S domain-containing protein [Candidatus Woesearchaeota archaeon]|nr:Rieske 2Fe-2S domain-containing protein [Candidatus Woesearchaeota archaeon]
MGEFVKVASVKDIAPGSSRIVELKGEPIAIFNVKGSFYAIHNTCLHQGGPLGEGFVDDNGLTVECPWHGWTYKLQTGQTTFDPGKKVKIYKVKVQGSDVFLEI